MSTLLTYYNPLEFLLRYVSIVGIIIAIVGCSILMMAKRITIAKRHSSVIDKNDKLYFTLQMVGITLILIAMIIIALPINATLYR